MFLDRPNRRIIPRWRDFLTTVALGELGSAIPKQPRHGWPDSTLQETRTAWAESKTLWHALDFVGSAFSLNVADDEVLSAARYVVANHADSSPRAGLALAGAMLAGTPGTPAMAEVQDESNEARRAAIRQKRSHTMRDPRNPIAWVDLARLYTVLGQIPQAERAIEVALKVSPANRFVLRSATRFFVHIGDRERALKLLRASEVLSDPWICAAEIGVSTLQQIPPRQAKIGRHLLSDADFSSFSKTELASALATLELQGGRSGLAKKLFRQSLADPNENSLAQAEWASTQVGQLGVDEAGPRVVRSFEARALLGLKTGDWDLAAKNSLNWLFDQPFSSRPAGVASYIFSTIYDEQGRAEDILKASLVSNPRDAGLTNNLAFALANQGKTGEAEDVLSSVAPESADDGARVTLLATRGLVMFRKGIPGVGRELYLSAIELAKRKALPKYEALAALYLAREELLAKLPAADDDLRRARQLASERDEPDVAFILDKVSRMAATGHTESP